MIDALSKGNITIDGNIGSGKTTVIRHLCGTAGGQPDLEPIEAWAPYLRRIYDEGTGYYDFQLQAWIDRCWPAQPAGLWIERSPLFQEKVFVRANADAGRFSPHDLDTLSRLYGLAKARWAPAAYVYLRSSPERCYERMIQRGRAEEAGVPLDYLRRIHELHELVVKADIPSSSKLVIVEVDGKTVEEVCEEILSRL